MHTLVTQDQHTDELTTTTLAIAEGLELKHKSVIELTRKCLNELEEFGRVPFKIQLFETAGGVQRRQYAILNEPQATLLFTSMRNNRIVKAFKVRLIKEFYRMRQELQQVSPVVNQQFDPATLPRKQILMMALEAEERAG